MQNTEGKDLIMKKKKSGNSEKQYGPIKWMQDVISVNTNAVWWYGMVKILYQNIISHTLVKTQAPDFK